LNLRDRFVVEFILSIADGLLAMTGEKTSYEVIKIDGFAKTRFFDFSVIPAEAGIQ